MIRIGVDYYPEHWPRELWQQDIDLMVKTGVTTVRIAEFSWGLLEPKEGQFDFEWLDTAVKMLGEAGIEIILGTPTNCPPLWLYRTHPETLQVERNGQPTFTGLRGHRCYESPVFRRYAARIIEEMTRRYAQDPHVIAWQIDNEIDANHCNCPVCTAKFRAFLKEKYKTLPALNAAWGTDVWSGEISDWEQLTTPLGPQYQYSWMNPGYLLDYERFAAQSTADYAKFQVEVLRRRVPQAIPITTNACFGQNTMDFAQTFAPLDVVSYDNYPEVRQPENPEQVYSTAAALDLMRGTKRQNFWIMETLGGPKGCWCPISETPRPGMIEGYGLQELAHGADMVLYFRWRSAARGAEMFWHGLIDQSNVPGRRLAEFAALCKRVKTLDGLEAASVKSPVAILYGATQLEAFKLQMQSEGFDYWEQVRRWQDAFASLGVNTDIVDEEAELSGYKVVVLPCHYVTNPVTVQHLEAFAKAGGTVAVTARSGVKDEANGCVMQPLPGAFAALCGCTVSEYDPVGPRRVPVQLDGQTIDATLWCDILKLGTAEAAARYDGEFYAGQPAVARNAFGKGFGWYVGVCGSRALCRKLAARWLDEQAVPYEPDLPAGVQITTRESETVRWRFVFNETEHAQQLTLGGESISLPPYATRIEKLPLDENGMEQRAGMQLL